MELNFQVNYLGGFLLTQLLLDSMSPNARIISTSSSLHSAAGKIRFNDIQCINPFSYLRAYNHSKLLQVSWTYELQRRLKAQGSKITVNAFHPGVVKTELARHFKGVVGVMFAVAQRLIFIEPEKAAHLPLYLASDPEMEGKGGEYWSGTKAEKSSKATYDEPAAKKLWEVSAVLSGLDSKYAIDKIFEEDLKEEEGELQEFHNAQGEGRSLLGGSIIIRATSEQTLGQFGVVEFVFQPKHKGPPAHTLHGTDESWFVSQGSVTAVVDGKTTEIKQGGYIYIPRGKSRTISSESGARVIDTFYPGGMEQFFLELSELSLEGPPKEEQMSVLQTKYRWDWTK